MKVPLYKSKIFWERLVKSQTELAKRLDAKEDILTDDDIQLLNAIIRRISSDAQEFLQVVDFLNKKHNSNINPPTRAEQQSKGTGFTYLLKEFESRKSPEKQHLKINDRFFGTD